MSFSKNSYMSDMEDYEQNGAYDGMTFDDWRKEKEKKRRDKYERDKKYSSSYYDDEIPDTSKQYIDEDDMENDPDYWTNLQDYDGEC
ncbi:MAG: hypothetical protein SPF70_01445 [Lachnospiraceae bacterium]|nr:hypothetical protein [Lachnospiraceae bacterium]